MDFPLVPPTFKSLQAASEVEPGIPLNIIGVCTDYKDVMKSRGPDMTIGFTLHDPSWPEGLGLPVRFFHKVAERLPKVTSTGDIVILRNVKNTDFKGERVSFSNSASSWVVLEYESVKNSTCETGTDILVHRSGQSPYLAPQPNILELKYAKAILDLDDSTRWRAPLTTPRAMDDVPSAQGLRVNADFTSRDKFTLVSDAAVPYGRKGIFCDLFCEVRRIWEGPHGDRCEVSVTDYTENSNLYDYRHGSAEEGMRHDYGDSFGYANGACKVWPGPWGKLTIAVNCWRPHCSFVMRNVQLGDFIYLRNVQITYDRDGTKLEGHCRTDHFNPDKVNVHLVKKSEAETDEKFKALLRRKRDYEELCKRLGLRFIRDAKPARPQDKGAKNDKEDEPLMSKGAKRNRKNKAKAKEATATGDAEILNHTRPPLAQTLTSNATVRCNNVDIPSTTIANIMDRSILLRETAAGNPYYAPFQNCRYKSRVRVIDFLPPALENFCVPTRASAYSQLSNQGSVSDIDPTQSPIDDEDDEDVKWEWRFILLVEDAKAPADTTPAHMELIVCRADAEYLLREDACDLRKNPRALARLKEKLFHLWGDLQEQKDELEDPDDFEHLKPQGRPFECFIEEYGVPSGEDEGKKEEDVNIWERKFGLCMTTISIA